MVTPWGRCHVFITDLSYVCKGHRITDRSPFSLARGRWPDALGPLPLFPFLEIYQDVQALGTGKLPSSTLGVGVQAGAQRSPAPSRQRSPLGVCPRSPERQHYMRVCMGWNTLCCDLQGFPEGLPTRLGGGALGSL